MVLFSVCYVIRPNDDFRKVRSKYNLLAEFDDTSIWHREEIDNEWTINLPEISFWRGDEKREDNDLPSVRGFHPHGRVKIIFLARFWKRMSQYKTPSYQEALQVLMGDPPFNIALFDRWWTIERLEDSEVDFSWTIDHLGVDDLEPFVSLEDTNRDTWIEDIIVIKREKTDKPK